MKKGGSKRKGDPKKTGGAKKTSKGGANCGSKSKRTVSLNNDYIMMINGTICANNTACYEPRRSAAELHRAPFPKQNDTYRSNIELQVKN
jgi:hypothetical protein